MELQEQLRLLPEKPGVYLMKNAEGRIIYIGKAVSLKNRVRSYFQAARNLTSKVLSMVGQVRDIEFITTSNEVEALILESNLIKKYKPKYNIRLRDDKHYPYLRVTLGEEWPRLQVARALKKGKDRYFGPYTTSTAMWETMKLCRKLFPLRTCNRVEAHTRPCLNYHIGRCLGPCLQDFRDREQYDAAVKELCLFLEGKHEDLVERLRRRMEEAAENLQFERAAEIRDQIRAVEQVVEKQKIISPGLEDLDAIAFARGGDETVVQVFFIRQGKLLGRDQFILSGTGEMTEGEIMQAFVQQHYNESDFIPREILVSEDPEGKAIIEEWLSSKRGGKVAVRRPQRGEKRDLVEMVAENARAGLQERQTETRKEMESTEGAIEDLRDYLGLSRLPYRIECYDISHVQGAETVASMVVFEGGKPKKEDYRRFKIRQTRGPNDFLAMQEVIDRRFRRGLEERAAISEGRVKDLEAISEGRVRDGEPKFAAFPDLVIVDGGKGQLSAAREIMHRLELGHIPTFGLAKEEEHLFAEGNPDPIMLPRDSQALYLLQRVRDEAHRFAVGYHRTLHRQAGIKSALDEVPGIGPKRKKALLRHFGSVKRIREASVDEIAGVPGLTRDLAEKVLEHLRR